MWRYATNAFIERVIKQAASLILLSDEVSNSNFGMTASTNSADAIYAADGLISHSAPLWYSDAGAYMDQWLQVNLCVDFLLYYTPYPAKILSPFLSTAPLQCVPKILFTQATIDCLTNNKTKDALHNEAVILNTILVVTQLAIA